MKRLIMFLVRKRLGLKKYEFFRFDNQKSKDIYYFTRDGLRKIVPEWDNLNVPSRVSFNWLMSDECKAVKVEGYDGYFVR